MSCQVLFVVNKENVRKLIQSLENNILVSLSYLLWPLKTFYRISKTQKKIQHPPPTTIITENKMTPDLA